MRRKDQNPLFRYTTTAEQGASLRAERHGSLVLVTPLTEAASKWIEDTIPADATRADDSLVIEPRYFQHFADSAISAGFTFERAALPN